MSFETIATIIIAMITASIPGLLAYRKTKADATKTLIDAATGLVEPLRKRITELESEQSTLFGRIRDLEKRVRDLECENSGLLETNRLLRAGINLLTHQLESHSLVPVWKPPVDYPEELDGE